MSESGQLPPPNHVSDGGSSGVRQPGDVVIIDNLKAHHVAGVREAIPPTQPINLGSYN
jgi:hypothetical protein